MLTPIKSDLLKYEIITYIYDIVNINKFRYSIISCKKHLEFLKSNIHYVILNIKSTNYILLFKYFESVKKNMILLIDRTTLDFTPSDLKYVANKSKIFYFPIDVESINKNFFRGTIIDGKYYKHFFYVYNIFMYKGENRIFESTLESWNQIQSDKLPFIKEIQYFSYQQIPELKEQFKNGINGLMFIPKIPNNQFLYLYRDEQINKSVEEDKTSLLKISTNGIPDVYFYIEGDETHLLYIPDIETSLNCRNYFKDSKTKTLKCKFNSELCKWQPVF